MGSNRIRTDCVNMVLVTGFLADYRWVKDSAGSWASVEGQLEGPVRKAKAVAKDTNFVGPFLPVAADIAAARCVGSVGIVLIEWLLQQRRRQGRLNR